MELSFGGSIFFMYLCNLNKKDMDIDLNKCSEGDLLISSHGAKLNYDI